MRFGYSGEQVPRMPLTFHYICFKYFKNVDSIARFSNVLTDSYGVWGLLLITVALLLFVFQMYYYLGIYARIPKYRNDKRMPARSDFTEGISVIVLLNEDMWYLENTLPKLLSQDYKKYEVLVVELGTSEEFSNDLAAMKYHYPHLVTTRMESTSRFPISDKMAYNVGIKGASYANIILATSVSYPVSQKWLSCMAKGFVNGEVVLGYAGMEQRPEFFNQMIRASRFMSSVRWLSSAIERKPYRGTIHNIGFTKDIYFRYKGFDYLNMNMGIDDLFIQRIASNVNTSVVMNPHATVRERQWGGADWWRERRKFCLASLPYYHAEAKNNVFLEEANRLLFYIVMVVVLVIMPLEIKIGGAFLWLFRQIIVRYKMRQVRRRLGEPGIGNALMLYDLISPIIRLWLVIMSRLRPASGIWR